MTAMRRKPADRGLYHKKLWQNLKRQGMTGGLYVKVAISIAPRASATGKWIMNWMAV